MPFHTYSLFKSIEAFDQSSKMLFFFNFSLPFHTFHQKNVFRPKICFPFFSEFRRWHFEWSFAARPRPTASACTCSPWEGAGTSRTRSPGPSRVGWRFRPGAESRAATGSTGSGWPSSPGRSRDQGSRWCRTPPGRIKMWLSW